MNEEQRKVVEQIEEHEGKNPSDYAWTPKRDVLTLCAIIREQERRIEELDGELVALWSKWKGIKANLETCLLPDSYGRGGRIIDHLTSVAFLYEVRRWIKEAEESK